MSRITVGILFAAIALIILAVYFEVSFVAGGSGVVFVVALGYAYVVAKREAALLSYAVNERDAEQSSKHSAPAAKPVGMSGPPRARSL